MTRITAPVALLLLAIISAAAFVGGVGLLAGLAWGLIAGGLLGLVFAVMLYDTGKDTGKGP